MIRLPAAMPSCTCDNCVRCCKRNPGWFTPRQMAPLERHYGKPLEQLLATHLMLDWWNADDRLPFLWIVSPRSTKAGGIFAPEMPPLDFDWHRGCCALLQNNRCTLHNIGLKPRECVIAHHSIVKNNGAHWKIAATWNKPNWQFRLAAIAKQTWKGAR